MLKCLYKVLAWSFIIAQYLVLVFIGWGFYVAWTLDPAKGYLYY